MYIIVIIIIIHQQVSDFFRYEASWETLLHV